MSAFCVTPNPPPSVETWKLWMSFKFGPKEERERDASHSHTLHCTAAHRVAHHVHRSPQSHTYAHIARPARVHIQHNCTSTYTHRPILIHNHNGGVGFLGDGSSTSLDDGFPRSNQDNSIVLTDQSSDPGGKRFQLLEKC